MGDFKDDRHSACTGDGDGQIQRKNKTNTDRKRHDLCEQRRFNCDNHHSIGPRSLLSQ